LLGVSVALRDKLGLDHIRDQVVLVAHELHHFGRGGDGVRGSLGGAARLACHHKSRQADRDQSCREQTLGHCQNSVLNGRSEFKHLFEKKARRAQGKYVTFSVLAFDATGS
jgi:hypothetical protein